MGTKVKVNLPSSSFVLSFVSLWLFLLKLPFFGMSMQFVCWNAVSRRLNISMCCLISGGDSAEGTIQVAYRHQTRSSDATCRSPLSSAESNKSMMFKSICLIVSSSNHMAILKFSKEL